jgi:putative endonuclease
MKIKTENFNKGRSGEDLAKKYLTKKGFEWIESNFLCNMGEIYLIMTDKDWLVFVEVKFKSDDKFGIPEEMISDWKIAQVKRIGQIYLMTRPEINKKYSKYRVDAVCILGEQITHYENMC